MRTEAFKGVVLALIGCIHHDLATCIRFLLRKNTWKKREGWRAKFITLTKYVLFN